MTSLSKCIVISVSNVSCAAVFILVLKWVKLPAVHILNQTCVDVLIMVQFVVASIVLEIEHFQSRVKTVPILCEIEKVVDVDDVEFVVFVHL